MRLFALALIGLATLTLATRTFAVSGPGRIELGAETDDNAPVAPPDAGAAAALAGDEPAAPPPAMLKKLEPIARLISKELAMEPALNPGEVMSWGPGDINGDRIPEILVSWGRGTVAGGIALVTHGANGQELMAVMDLKRPVLKVQTIALAGDRTRHLLVRSGADQHAGSSERFTEVLALHGHTFRSIWMHRDVDNIANNTDTHAAREASLSDVTFEQGIGGRPGTISLTVRRFYAPAGTGEEGAVEKGQQLRRFTYDRTGGTLVERKVTDAERAAARAADDEVDSILQGSAGPTNEPAAADGKGAAPTKEARPAADAGEDEEDGSPNEAPAKRPASHESAADTTP